MERVNIYFTFQVLASGSAVTGYTINPATIQSCTELILSKLFSSELDYELEDFDINSVCNIVIQTNNEYTIDNIVRFYNDGELMNWLTREYDKSKLINLVKTYLPTCFPCNIINADIVPPKNWTLKY